MLFPLDKDTQRLYPFRRRRRFPSPLFAILFPLRLDTFLPWQQQAACCIFCSIASACRGLRFGLVFRGEFQRPIEGLRTRPSSSSSTASFRTIIFVDTRCRLSFVSSDPFFPFRVIFRIGYQIAAHKFCAQNGRTQTIPVCLLLLLHFISTKYGRPWSSIESTFARTTPGDNDKGAARGQPTSHARNDEANDLGLFRQVCRNFGECVSSLCSMSLW
jgi:hypothetical protein